MLSETKDFNAGYASSSNSKCQKCENFITPKDTLRLGVIVQSPKFDGKVTQWFHFECFFQEYTPRRVTSIKGFGYLRWSDQQRIKKQIGVDIVNAEDLKTIFLPEIEVIEVDSVLEDSSNSFLIEYSKSNRSKCKNAII